MQKAFRYSSSKTKKEIINPALKEFVENAKKLSLLDLREKNVNMIQYNHVNIFNKTM